jgi:hypothetical protein
MSSAELLVLSVLPDKSTFANRSMIRVGPHPNGG